MKQPPTTIANQQRAKKRPNNGVNDEAELDEDLELDKYSKASIVHKETRPTFRRDRAKRPRYNPAAEFTA
jgi:hypothetical protein